MNEKTMALAALMNAKKARTAANSATGKIYVVIMEQVDDVMDDGTYFVGYLSDESNEDLCEMRDKGYTLVAEYWDENGERIHHEFITQTHNNFFEFYNYRSTTDPLKYEGRHRYPWYEQ